jgi:hypothetical protein
MHWKSLGAESASDIAYMCTSAAEVRAQVAEKMSEELIIAACDGWGLAQAAAAEATEESATALAEAIIQPGRSLKPPPRLTIQPRSLTAMPARTPFQVNPGSGKLKWGEAKQVGKGRVTAIEASAEAIYAVYLELGEEGLQWDPVHSSETEARREAILRPFLKMEPKLLRTRVRLLTKYREWLHQHRSSDNSWWRIGPTGLSQYLEHRTLGGPTAAAGALQGFKWWNVHVGTSFPTEARAVSGYLAPTEGHQLRPALELQPADLYNLCVAARRHGGTVGLAYRMVLLAIFDVLRFTHHERTAWQGTTPRLVYFRCAKGKRRTQGGHRPPFTFAVPRVWAPSFGDLFGPLLHFWQQSLSRGGDAAPGLLPGLQARALTGGVSDNAAWLDKPMKYPQWCGLLQGALVGTGHSPASAALHTFNSARRALPTAADTFEVGDTDAQALSNWQEVPKTTKERGKATFPMCRRYAGSTTSFTGEIKARILAAVFDGIAAAARRKAITLTVDRFLPVGAITWEDLRTVRGEVEVETAADGPEWFIQARPTGTPTLGTPMQDSQGEGEKGGSDNEEKSSDDDSSSSSSSAAAGAPSDSEPEASPLEWVQVASKVHIVGEFSIEGAAIPWCRLGSGRPFSTPTRDTGHGAASACATGAVCLRCLGRAPLAVRTAIREVSMLS